MKVTSISPSPSASHGLRAFLNRLESQYHRPEFLYSDPLEFVHRYADPWDQETVALIAALMAYGNVKQIRRSVAGALERAEELAGSPAELVRRLGDPAKAAFQEKARRRFEDWAHRFNVGGDLLILLRLLSESWKRHGSLGAHFVSHLDPNHEDIGPALNAFNAEWKSWIRELKLKPRDSFFYLLTAPGDGSCCKRWCMFLRWMGRRDLEMPVDPGLWTEGGALAGTFPKGRVLKPSQLVIPLDTHTGRISKYIGLTSRKSVDWKAALEVTQSLKACDPKDPIRYDFALARLGILDFCQNEYRRDVCESCQLFPVCSLALKGKGREARRRNGARTTGFKE